MRQCANFAPGTGARSPKPEAYGIRGYGGRGEDWRIPNFKFQLVYVQSTYTQCRHLWCQIRDSEPSNYNSPPAITLNQRVATRGRQLFGLRSYGGSDIPSDIPGVFLTPYHQSDRYI